MKKSISIVLAMVLVFGTITFTPALEKTAYADTEGIFTYTVSNGEATITGCDEINTYGDIIIPDNLGGYPVTAIGDNAFNHCKGLSSILIPIGVTCIGNRAFEGCYSLTSITIPYSVASIGEQVFNNCLGLSNIEVDALNSKYSSVDGVLLDAGKTTLFVCPNGKVGEYTVPNSVIQISDFAFYNCNYLTNIIIPNSVNKIGEWAFQNCSQLTGIAIPSSVESIGMGAFSNCSILTNIEVDISNSNYSSIDGVLFDASKKLLLEYPCGKVGNYIVPDGVTDICDYSFYLCSNLTSITLPHSVLSIGEGAFQWCDSLNSITIPNNVTTIKSWAFLNCSNLKSANIPSSVTSFGIRVFDYCDNLTIYTTQGSSAFAYAFNNNIRFVLIDTCSDPNLIYTFFIENDEATISGIQYYTGDSIIIPESLGGYPVTAIGVQAFRNFDTLTSITLPNGIKRIDNRAFEGCINLNAINVPSSVTCIGEYAFSGCKSLNAIDIPNGVTSLGNFVFSESGLTSITIPDSVISIGEYAFNSCESLSSVCLSNNITTISVGTFDNCRNLNSITIPDSVISIESCAFFGTGFSTITLSNNLKTIGDSAFANCSLKSILLPDSLTSISSSAFFESAIETITIPKNVTNIDTGAFYDCWYLKQIDVDTSNSKYCSVDGVLFDTIEKTLVAYPKGKQMINAIQIPNWVKKIGKLAFADCYNFDTVIIPDGVEEIDEHAFCNSGIKSIKISDSVTDIKSQAFCCCGDLSSVILSKYLITIGDYAFDSCKSLASVNIPGGVESIGNHAFDYCDRLSLISIPISVTNIGDDALNNCDNLTIYGEAGSSAQTYANYNGIPFVVFNLDYDFSVEICDASTATNTADYKVKIINIKQQPKTAYLAIALYDEQNQLAGIKCENITLDGLLNNTIVESIPLSSINSNSTVTAKAYLWNDVNQIQPLAEKWENSNVIE